MKILISSCLLGQEVRYDGKSSLSSIPNLELFNKITNSCEIFSICPEVAGGLETPREPAEGKNGKVVTNSGLDLTNEFLFGASETLKLCLQEEIKVALLKAKSPSCGNIKVYDGTFSRTLIDGSGETAKLLMENGVKVFNEQQLEELELFINQVG